MRPLFASQELVEPRDENRRYPSGLYGRRCMRERDLGITVTDMTGISENAVLAFCAALRIDIVAIT